MTRAERAELLRYLETCRDELGMKFPVEVSQRPAEGCGDAAATMHWRGRTMVFWGGPAFWAGSADFKRLCVAHEFGHAQDKPTATLIDTWEETGAISKRAHAEYERREEARIMAAEHLIARLLPEWPG